MPIPSSPRRSNPSKGGLPSSNSRSNRNGSLPSLDSDLSNNSHDDNTFTPIPIDEVTSDELNEESTVRRNSSSRSISYTPIDDEEEPDYDYDDDDSETDDDGHVADVVDLSKNQKPQRKNSKDKNSNPADKKGFSLGKKKKDDNKLPAGYTDDTFINAKDAKLEPYGRKKKRKARVSEFDKRKNIRQKQQIVQIAALTLVGIMAAAGVKNAVIPPKSLTPDQVKSIVTTTIGDTGFPLNSGRGFVENFMKAYLNQSSDGGVSSRVLNYYYNGSLGTADDSQSNNSTNSQFSGDYQEKTLYGPTIFSMRSLTSTSASYVVGALTQTQTSKSSAPSDGSTAKWTFFNVNVFFDSKTNSFKITPESPTIIPPVNIADSSIVPKNKSLGDEIQDDNVTNSIKPVIQGYIQGYQSSSPTNHSNLDQYITSTSDINLATGLDGRYTLAGDIDNAVTFTAYNDGILGEIKAEVKVIWQDTADVENSAQFTSTYVMTLEKQANGKYLVSKFSPEYYVPGEASSANQ